MPTEYYNAQEQRMRNFNVFRNSRQFIQITFLLLEFSYNLSNNNLSILLEHFIQYLEYGLDISKFIFIWTRFAFQIYYINARKIMTVSPKLKEIIHIGPYDILHVASETFLNYANMLDNKAWGSLSLSL